MSDTGLPQRRELLMPEPMIFWCRHQLGKTTTVLVDRVIKMLKEDPNLNIDQLLMVTFTNEAADNMRSGFGAVWKKGQQPSSRSDQPAGDCPHQYDSYFCQQLIKRYYCRSDPVSHMTDETETTFRKIKSGRS